MKKKNVVICFGKRSTLHRILASLLYAIAFFLIYKYFYLNENFIKINEYIAMRSNLFAIIIVISFAFKFSINISFHFNFQEMEYRKYHYIGFLGYGKWIKLKKLNRVSTFLNNRNECEVNIWDIKNNRHKIAIFNNIDEAVLYGRDLAKTLQINFKERK